MFFGRFHQMSSRRGHRSNRHWTLPKGRSNEHLRDYPRAVASERAQLQAERAVLEGVLRDLESREARMDALEAENAQGTA
jgi:hypothetical protein